MELELAACEIDRDDVAWGDVVGGRWDDADRFAGSEQRAHRCTAERHVDGATLAQQCRGEHGPDHGGPPRRARTMRAASGPLRLVKGSAGTAPTTRGTV